MTRLLVILMFLVGFIEAKSQEKIEINSKRLFQVSVGVVDMKKILPNHQLINHLGLLLKKKEEHTEINLLNLKMLLEMKRNETNKTKCFCQRVYATKVKELSKKSMN